MERYWIAINGSTCAMTAMPMRRPEVCPRPQLLIGFPTFEQAREAQRVCLKEPIPEVRRFVQSLTPAKAAGDVVIIRYDDPDPPVPGGTTAWLDTPLPSNVN